MVCIRHSRTVALPSEPDARMPEANELLNAARSSNADTKVVPSDRATVSTRLSGSTL